MDAIDFCELSVEQEEYLVALLCTRGACTVDWMARELDELCRASACPETAASTSILVPTASEARE